MRVRLEQATGCGGNVWLLVADDGREVAFQTDWDWPGLASNFGYVSCECGRTDGTVDCPHKTASRMIADAYDFLLEHEGETVEAPGYFDE